MFLRLRGYLELVVLRRNTVRCASGMSGYQELRNAVRCAVSESGESLWPVLMPLISPVFLPLLLWSLGDATAIL